MSNFKWASSAPILLGLFVILSIVLHWNIWNQDVAGIHAWRQTQTLTVAENFASEDFNIMIPRINSRGAGDGIMRMEFPITQWLIAIPYKIFGPNITWARILSFLINASSVIGFYFLLTGYGLRKKIAIAGAWCFGWSPVVFYYAVNPLPDNLALGLAIWSLAFLIRFNQKRKLEYLLGFAILLSMATLAKLPFILFGAGFIPIFVSRIKQKNFKGTLLECGVIGLSLIPAIAWYVWVIPSWGNAQIISGVGSTQSFDFQLAFSNVWGIVSSTLPELLINYGSILFFIAGLFSLVKDKISLSNRWIELSILLAVLAYYLYEINLIGMAHDYYLFPFLPLIFLITAKGLNYIDQQDLKPVKFLAAICIVIIPITAFLRCQSRWIPNQGEWALIENKSELQAIGNPSDLVIVGEDLSSHIFLYHIKKKGWTFSQNGLSNATAVEMQRQGASYLYSTNPIIDEQLNSANLIGNAVFSKDGISVYELKEPSVR